MGCKRFAVLLSADDSNYMKTTYGVFKEMLSEEGESRDVSRGEIPNEAYIEACDGFVINGSCSDAHGNDPWIVGLVEPLRRLDRSKKRALGICFGA